MPGTALVVAGGSPPDPSVVAALPPIDVCIAADGGGDACLAAGLVVDVLIGDLDSISAKGLVALREDGVEIVAYPEAKDATDLELALLRAKGTEPDRLIVLGVGGGRLDHLLANIGVVAGSAVPGRPVEIWDGTTRLVATVDEATIEGEPGDLVSLLPIFGTASGVTTVGLRYPLDNEELIHGTARGISNVLEEPLAIVTVRSGTVLVVTPLTGRSEVR